MPTIDPAGLPLLRLLQLVSPALPVGGFTYSQGIEWAVEAGWIRTAADTADWLADQRDGTLTGVDLPLLLRLHAAAGARDAAALGALTDELLAWRETAELRAEEAARGRALADLLVALGLLTAPERPQERPAIARPNAAAREHATRTPTPTPAAPDWPPSPWHPVAARAGLTGFAIAARAWRVSAPTTLTGYAWAWLEGLTLAAVKLVPLGQTDGQRILLGLAGSLPRAVATALDLTDADLGAAHPALAIASSNHEVQYTRLFRS